MFLNSHGYFSNDADSMRYEEPGTLPCSITKKNPSIDSVLAILSDFSITIRVQHLVLSWLPTDVLMLLVTQLYINAYLQLHFRMGSSSRSRSPYVSKNIKTFDGLIAFSSTSSPPCNAYP